MTVKVRITNVQHVRIVRPFRFRMLEIPKLNAAALALNPVSYTHLTLPTNREV